MLNCAQDCGFYQKELHWLQTGALEAEIGALKNQLQALQLEAKAMEADKTHTCLCPLWFSFKQVSELGPVILYFISWSV
jgi:hypothetical protein